MVHGIFRRIRSSEATIRRRFATVENSGTAKLALRVTIGGCWRFAEPRTRNNFRKSKVAITLRNGDFIGWDRLPACQKYGENDRLEALSLPTFLHDPMIGL
jgi:hypothetical protein